MEPKTKIPAYLAPVLLGDAHTPAWRQVHRRAAALRRRYPEDQAIRLLHWEWLHGYGNARDLRATAWLILHPTMIAQGGPEGGGA